MSKKFEIQKAIYGLTSIGIRLSRETTFDASRPMGNVAKSTVNTVACAAFVGLFDEVKNVLPRCAEWLRYAISNRENLGSVTEYHLSLLHQALALVVWMQHGSISEEIWDSALRNDQKAIAIDETLYLAKDLVSMRLDHILPMAVLSGNWDAAITEYEGALGTPKTKGKTSSMTPRRYAYEVARSRVGLGDMLDLHALGEAVLSGNIEHYLAYGRYLEAATLVCLVRSRGEGSSDAIAAMRSVVDGSSRLP